jgi:hypothetical protein
MLVPSLPAEADEAAQDKLGEAHGNVFKARVLETVKPFPGPANYWLGPSRLGRGCARLLRIAPPLPSIVQRLVGAIGAGRISPAQPVAVDEHDAAQHPRSSTRGLPWLLGKNSRSRSTCSSVSQAGRSSAVSSRSLNQVAPLTSIGPDPSYATGPASRPGTHTSDSHGDRNVIQPRH